MHLTPRSSVLFPHGPVSCVLHNLTENDNGLTRSGGGEGIKKKRMDMKSAKLLCMPRLKGESYKKRRDGVMKGEERRSFLIPCCCMNKSSIQNIKVNIVQT